jgi:N-formylglutamate deformylase
MDPFVFRPPQTDPVPILLSVPHCGTTFPDELRSDYIPQMMQAPDDTDWFVHNLYDFAACMGIGMVHAVYSRWVIDLNRDPESKPLYNDGRIITGLCPTTDFFGRSLYVDGRTEVATTEIQRRLQHYYQPYYQEVQRRLDELKSRFGKVLLWDCHSIRQIVPTIQQAPFPDLILGSADNTSASPSLIQSVVLSLENSGYSFQHNKPFKGGHITRSFGKPSESQHALQLEMTKINYMDDHELEYSEGRAQKMRKLLHETFNGLIKELR